MNKNTYDVIVIGSGISGMAAGIIAAKEGEKTLVLEQHAVPGGLMQTYKRKQAIFPTGVHRLGSLEQGQPLWYYFQYLDIMDKLSLEKLDEDCFEKIYFPGKEYQIPMDHERYKQRVLEYFPKEQKAIEAYFKEFKKITSTIGYYDPSINPEKDLTMEYTGSLDDYFNSISASKNLKNLLSGNSPLYGLSSKQCPMLTHFIISDCYLNSSFRINENKTSFAQTVVDSFKAHGGELRTQALVKQIMVDQGAAKGVVLNNDEKIFSDKVIYSGHPGLLLDICPPELFRPVYRKRLQNEHNEFGVFGVALKVSEHVCPVKKNDAFIYDSWDVDANYVQSTLLKDAPAGMVFLSALPPSPEHGYSVTALTGIGIEDIKLLKRHYQKNTYKQFKEIICKKIMDNIKPVFQDGLDSVEIIDTYSPVTFSRYTLTKNGSAYGIQKTADNFLQGFFKPATKVKNLFLTGQSIAFSGIHGAVVSSFALGSLLYGKDYLMNKVAKIQ